MDSIRGTAFLKFGELVAERGACVRDFLAPYRIGLDVVGSFDKQLPYKSLVQIFEGSAQALQLPHFGLELATRQGFALAGPLQQLAHSAPTVGDALVAVIRYMSVYSPSILFRLERRPNQALLYFDNALPSNTETPQIVEKSVLHGKLLISELTGRPWQPKAVMFRHQALGEMATYRDYFGCSALFGQDHNALVMPVEVLQRACLHHDATLHAIVRFYLEAHGDVDDDLVAKVARKIQTLLPSRRCNLEQVAYSLGLHPRTLQRRLSEDGVDFEEHLERIRRRQATYMLRHTTLGVAQIAGELGYRRTTSFCRAHQRWFDMTPLEHRRLHGDANIVSMAAAD